MKITLKNPVNNNEFIYEWYSDGVDKSDKEFYGIPDFFVQDESNLTEKQSDFYNEVKFPNYDDIDDFGTLIDKASKSIFAKKLDEELPYGSKILEIGCGTGQLSIFLSRYNRKIFSTDLSKGSLIEAKKFIDKCGINNVYLCRMNIFRNLLPENYFDYVISNGVLHHTFNTKLAFENISKLVKPKGYILIGLYHKHGRFFHSIRQKIIGKFGKSFNFLDSFFSKNVSESKKKAWFMDQYQNPHETSHTANEVITWLEECGFEYISSIPFDFSEEEKILEKKPKQSNFKLSLKENLEMLNLKNLVEGGFFIVVGRKKNI